MFFETPSPDYFAPATYRMYDADGKVLDRKFDIQFKRLKSSEHEAMDVEVQKLRKALHPKPYDDLLAKVVLAWRVEMNGEVKTIPFTPTALAEMEEQFPGFAFVCAVAFYASIAPAVAANHTAKN